jgi:hypothetical protein
VGGAQDAGQPARRAACVGVIVVGGHVTMFVVQGGIAWAGPVIAVWLLTEACDLLTTA